MYISISYLNRLPSLHCLQVSCLSVESTFVAKTRVACLLCTVYGSVEETRAVRTDGRTYPSYHLLDTLERNVDEKVS